MSKSDSPAAASKPGAPAPGKPADKADTPDTATATPSGDGKAEVGGPKGPEPTRYGDWEKKGRCVDF